MSLSPHFIPLQVVSFCSLCLPLSISSFSLSPLLEIDLSLQMREALSSASLSHLRICIHFIIHSPMHESTRRARSMFERRRAKCDSLLAIRLRKENISCFFSCPLNLLCALTPRQLVHWGFMLTCTIDLHDSLFMHSSQRKVDRRGDGKKYCNEQRRGRDELSIDISLMHTLTTCYGDWFVLLFLSRWMK